MRLLLVLLMVGPLALLGLGAAVTSPHATVARGPGLSHADLEHGRMIVRELGLRRLHEGEVRQVRLNAADIGLGLNVLVGHLSEGSARAAIDDGRLILRASWRLPWFARYLNLKLALAQSGDTLVADELRLGRIALPPRLSARIATRLLAGSEYGAQLKVAQDMLRRAELRAGHVDLTFVWHGEALSRAVRQPGVDETALDAYRAALAAVRGREHARHVGVAFALAQTRSAHADAIAENRAALTALAERALGDRLLGPRGLVEAPRRGRLRLDGRADFAQHFALSAYIAATGGARLSEITGEYKELRDAREGSGFSFNDVAANRAGIRLGEFCTHSRADAHTCQTRLAGTRDSTLYFPGVSDLPEFLPDAEFRRRFGGPDAPAYQYMLREIDRRIADLPLYREAGGPR